MSTTCAACQTENRDNAMFCHGCARKLPAFAATGPSVLEMMKLREPATPAGPMQDAESVAIPAGMFGFWIRVALLALVVGAAFVGWYAYVTRKVPPRPIDVVASSVAAPAPAPVPVPARVPVSVPVVPRNVVLDASPASSEAGLKPMPDAEPEAPAASPKPAQRRSQAPRVAATVHAAAADPRNGCENLNFIFAARCEASHCDQPAYARHPRCEAVREQRQRDVARRNPTLGF